MLDLVKSTQGRSEGDRAGAVGISLLFLKLEAFSYKATTGWPADTFKDFWPKRHAARLRDMISVLALTAFAALSFCLAMRQETIVPIERLELTFEPRPWPFADQQRAGINDHFSKLRKDKPALWNGRILLLHNYAINGTVSCGRPSVSSEPPSITPSVPQRKMPQTRSTGSGFFVTQAGHLLTNAHVVDDCTTISVKSSDGQTGIAQVIAADQNDDLALLRLERRIEMTAAFRIGRPTRAGENAVVFGFPLSGSWHPLEM